MDMSFEHEVRGSANEGLADQQDLDTDYAAITNADDGESLDVPDELPALSCDQAAATEQGRLRMERDLGGVAVLHETTIDLQDRRIASNPNRGLILDRTSGGVLEERYTIETASGGGSYEQDKDGTTDSEERTRVLRETMAVINAEVSRRDPGVEVDWGELATALVDKSAGSVGGERDTILTAAVLTSQLADDGRARVQFLRTIYERGIEGDMADACEGSPLVLLIDGPNAGNGNPRGYEADVVQSLNRLAGIFRIDRECLSTYLNQIEPRQESNGEGPVPSVAEAYQEVLEQLRQTGTTDRTAQMQAMRASLGGDKVRGVLLDPHKVERSCLVQMFIEELSNALLDGPDGTHSPFADELANLRAKEGVRLLSQPNADRVLAAYPQLVAAINGLRRDVESAFIDLGDEVIDRFGLEEVDTSDPDALTPEQRINLRYKELAGYGRQYKVMAQYLDFEEFVRESFREVIPSDPEGNVWEGAQTGGAVPLVAEEALVVTLGAALEANAPRLSGQHLAGLLHANRKVLVLLARNNAQDLAPRLFWGARLTKEGKLVLRSIIFPGSRDRYFAETVDCPAVKVGTPTKTSATERPVHGSNNLIDRLLAIIINEALARGLFELDAFRAGAEDD